MKFITLTRKQVRDVDRIAIEQFAMPGVVLMENAGRNAAAIIAQQISHLDTVTILCGSGNNGGDGYVIARHLVNHDFTVQLICAKPIDQLSGDAAINANMNCSVDNRPRMPKRVPCGQGWAVKMCPCVAHCSMHGFTCA